MGGAPNIEFRWVEDDDGLLEASYVDTTENIYVLTAVKTALYARHEGP